MRNRKLIWTMAACLLVFVFLTAEECTEDNATTKEKQTQKQNYQGLQAKQPADGMAYSPTRNSLKEWAGTWEEQGKLSYVYFFGANGDKVGYFIFEGLPVSYCASLTPVDDINRDASPDAIVTAPSIDGVYYSGSGCTQFFGYEAGTGTYFEFTAGGSFNYFLSDNPLTELDMKPIGKTTEDEARNLGK